MAGWLPRLLKGMAELAVLTYLSWTPHKGPWHLLLPWVTGRNPLKDHCKKCWYIRRLELLCCVWWVLLRTFFSPCIQRAIILYVSGQKSKQTNKAGSRSATPIRKGILDQRSYGAIMWSSFAYVKYIIPSLLICCANMYLEDQWNVDYILFQKSY